MQRPQLQILTFHGCIRWRISRRPCQKATEWKGNGFNSVLIWFPLQQLRNFGVHFVWWKSIETGDTEAVKYFNANAWAGKNTWHTRGWREIFTWNFRPIRLDLTWVSQLNESAYEAYNSRSKISTNGRQPLHLAGKNRTCTKLKAINLDNLNKGVSVLKIT